MIYRLLFLPLCWPLLLAGQGQSPIRPVLFSEVIIDDAFWKPRVDLVASTTVQACINYTEYKTARIRNFEKVAAGHTGPHEGIYYDDSDVYKALEAMAYSLQNRPDPALERKADEWIGKIAAAQEPDGYLNTYYSLNGLDKRYTDMEKHELYCAGHLFEAAVAYFNATGKRKLLDVAVRFADHLDQTFRLAGRPWVTGHEEIELALVKLFQTTGNRNYLQLADWLLDQRGRGLGRGRIWDEWGNPAYCQDDVPVREAREITGHAVRAMYLYTGAADVASATGDTGYSRAMHLVWEDVVGRNMYVTGGIGSSGRNEGFSEDFDLPNESAYCETCASVGMVFWNQRMNRLTGESKYYDVLERSLYNGALDGLSLSGDHFFYSNPLASDGQHARREWYGTACCPSNIARLVASLGSYLYARSERDLWVNLFVGSRTRVELAGTAVDIHTVTQYPWEGKVRISLSPAKASTFALHLRIPGWSLGQAVPGDLYRFQNAAPAAGYVLRVNGQALKPRLEKGYAVVERAWKAGDVVELDLPMEVQRITARPEVGADRDRVALQRGPLVYCVEGTDNQDNARDFIVPGNATFTTTPLMVLNEPVIAIRAEVPALAAAADGTLVKVIPKTITAIPYYAWCNRGSTSMQVWLPTRFGKMKVE